MSSCVPPSYVKDARGNLVANHVHLHEIAPGKVCQGRLIPLAGIRAEDKVNRGTTANYLGNTQHTSTEVDAGRVNVAGLTIESGEQVEEVVRRSGWINNPADPHIIKHHTCFTRRPDESTTLGRRNWCQTTEGLHPLRLTKMSPRAGRESYPHYKRGRRGGLKIVGPFGKGRRAHGTKGGV